MKPSLRNMCIYMPPNTWMCHTSKHVINTKQDETENSPFRPKV